MIVLTLPFPPSNLSPNNRDFWATKTKSKQSQREAGYYLAFPFRAQFAGNTGNIPISLKFYPPDNRHYDLDGLLSRCKQLNDGIALGLGVNDVQFRPIMIDMGAPDKANPRVEIEIN
jgi:hypothetical protein